MRIATFAAAILMLSCGVLASPACAQKGMGDKAGVGGQVEKPEVVPRSGSVLSVEVGPCKKTTGRSDKGAHFMLKTRKGRTLNIHLGPADAVDHITKRLTVGKKVKADVFRTEKMSEHHYVAKSITIDGSTFQLRDQRLQPFWAGNKEASRRRGSSKGFERSRGQGRGQGRGQESR